MSTFTRTTSRRSSLLLAAVVIGALLLAGCGGAATTTETVTVTVTASPEAASSEAAPTVESPSAEVTIPSETPTPVASPSDTPEPEPTATFEPTVFKGRGDRILKFDSGPFIATLTHAGSSNFVAYSLTTDLNEEDLLVNEIGRYKGTVLASSNEYGGMKIEADGSWTLSLVPIEEADIKTGPVKGKGSQVFYWGIDDNAIVDITHKGNSNFVVYLHTEDDSELLVNEIGNYSGEQIMSTGLVVIEADGSWMLTPQ